jgi:hypothetical protein
MRQLKIMRSLILCFAFIIVRLQKFAILNDIHLDLDYKPKYYDGSLDRDSYPCHSNKSASNEAYFGRKVCDPPLSLLSTTIDSIRSNGANYAAILTIGDFTSHHIPIKHQTMTKQ